jgi:hypothetical protein
LATSQAAQWDRRLAAIKRLAETAHAETRQEPEKDDEPG